jgi:anti-sigma factor RsiW
MSNSPNTGPNTGNHACATIELKDYFLKELPNPQQREVEAHVRGCQVCREELDRLQLTEAALFSLRDEEMPQRIAFVSDKVFEPSPWRRWWTAFWGSSARLGFASAAMLSAALLGSAVMRTAPAVRVGSDPHQATSVVHTAVVQTGTVHTGAVQPVSDVEIQTRIEAAVAKAVNAIESRRTQQTAQLVADLEDARRKLLLAAAEYDMSQKRSRVLTSSAYGMPPMGDGEVK